MLNAEPRTAEGDTGRRGTDEHDGAIQLTVTLAPDQLEVLAQRLAELLHERRDSGFLDVDGAAAFLGGCSKKSIYHMVERRRIRSRRIGSRLLFDPAELRQDVEPGS